MRFWDGYQRTQSVEANAVYNRLLQAVQADEGSKVAELSALVRDDYSRTVYASLGTFAAAKYHVEKGELEAAREQLAWAAENARDAQLKARSEEHTSELQSREKLVCRLLLEKKNPMVGMQMRRYR